MWGSHYGFTRPLCYGTLILYSFVSFCIIMYMNVYTVSEFRKNMRTIMDKVVQGEDVRINRGGISFRLVPEISGMKTKDLFSNSTEPPIANVDVTPKELQNIEKPFPVKPGEIQELPVTKLPTPKNETQVAWEFCKHGKRVDLCRFAQPGSPCK